MFSAVLLAISVSALIQFAAYYWRSLVACEAAQPVSRQVLDAANIEPAQLRGDDYRSLAELHRLTPELTAQSSGLGFVPLYFKFTQTISKLAAGRMSALAAWAEGESVLCARYAAVQIDRRLQSNLALAASIRSF
jgi:hypothetical protein